MSNTYQINQEKNGIEVSFANFPIISIREDMKNNGWKWSPFKKVWYNQNTEINKKYAENVLSAVLSNEQVKTQKYTKIDCVLENPNEKDNRYMYNVYKVLVLSNGKRLCIRKPKIHTHICSGYGYGITYSEAQNIIDTIQTKENAFVNYQVQRYQQDLWDNDGNDFYTINNSYDSDYNDYIAITTTSYGHYGQETERITNQNDIEKIHKAYKELTADIEKRAKTYWKRFRGTKLHTHTYDVND